MKKVILGVTGSIAAYKSAILTRLFVKKDIEVQVLMTESATTFISPLTLSTLSKRPVFTDVRGESGWNNHVEMGLWADAMVIAPASANTLAKLANGLCDNVLSAVFLSARCPVFVAPAMDVDMWHHPATQINIRRLQDFGVKIIPVGHGELASGLVGDGRMAEPEEILAYLENVFGTGDTRLVLPPPTAPAAPPDFSKAESAAPQNHPNHHHDEPQGLPLEGKTALVTAGPTYEPLDPVRFIGNHSTGKMGIAIAEALAEAGAKVRLVLGPTYLRPEHPGVEVVRVMSAQQMFAACAEVFLETDIAVLAAAVADYRPKEFSRTKIKKKDAELTLELAKTIDIAASLGMRKEPGQILVGFALETNDEAANARKKLESKNLDFIVLNSTQDAGAGFGHDTNKVAFIRRDGSQTEFPLKSKMAVAWDIVGEIARTANQKQA